MSAPTFGPEKIQVRPQFLDRPQYTLDRTLVPVTVSQRALPYIAPQCQALLRIGQQGSYVPRALIHGRKKQHLVILEKNSAMRIRALRDHASAAPRQLEGSLRHDIAIGVGNKRETNFFADHKVRT